MCRGRPTHTGAPKLAAETAVAKSGVPFTVLRPVLVYGPGVKGNLRTLMRLAALPVPLPFGALTNRRSLVGIDNLVAAIIHVLGHAASRGETYVVADPGRYQSPRSWRRCAPAWAGGRGWLRSRRGCIRLGLAMGGRGRDFAQIGGALVADPRKLIASGWRSGCGHVGRTCRDGPGGRGGMTADRHRRGHTDRGIAPPRGGPIIGHGSKFPDAATAAVAKSENLIPVHEKSVCLQAPHTPSAEAVARFS